MFFMKDTITISISTGTVIKIFAVLLMFSLLFYVSEFVVALLVAVVLASAVEAPIRFFGRFGVPRAVSVVSMFALLITFVAVVVFVLLPPLADDMAKFVKTLPSILDSVRIFGRDMGFKDLSSEIQDLSKNISSGQILTLLKNSLFGAGGFFATTSLVIGSIINVVLTFVLAFYLALEEHGVQKFLRLIVPREHEVYITDLWARAQRKIGLWMQGQLLLSVIIAVLVYIPMLVLHMPYATLLAILAFFGELIPVVGLTIATIPALFIAWTEGGASLLSIVALVYFIVSQLENHVLYPKVMNKLVGVPSLVVIIALVIGAKVAGIWGVLLAVPLASIFMELADDVNKRKNNHVATEL